MHLKTLQSRMAYDLLTVGLCWRYLKTVVYVVKESEAIGDVYMRPMLKMPILHMEFVRNYPSVNFNQITAEPEGY